MPAGRHFLAGNGPPPPPLPPPLVTPGLPPHPQQASLLTSGPALELECLRSPGILASLLYLLRTQDHLETKPLSPPKPPPPLQVSGTPLGGAPQLDPFHVSRIQPKPGSGGTTSMDPWVIPGEVLMLQKQGTSGSSLCVADRGRN